MLIVESECDVNCAYFAGTIMSSRGDAPGMTPSPVTAPIFLFLEADAKSSVGATFLGAMPWSPKSCTQYRSLVSFSCSSAKGAQI